MATIYIKRQTGTFGSFKAGKNIQKEVQKAQLFNELSQDPSINIFVCVCIHQLISHRQIKYTEANL